MACEGHPRRASSACQKVHTRAEFAAPCTKITGGRASSLVRRLCARSGFMPDILSPADDCQACWIAMSFGNAAGALAVSVVLFGLASDSRSPSSRPTDLAANQDERPAPAPVREALARAAATPEPAESSPQPVEPAKPSTLAPAGKSPATRSAPAGRTSLGERATRVSPPLSTTTPSTDDAPAQASAP